ncbi:polysaccharide biosynthesis/export family protein [Oculatella sp. LEGE 06141]|uniref:polysaccharide biosynthesis/export family protein n=1 Tax=Oculatella sp. LEGE 06141 TaxID=1828648 RepID=UPI001882AB35|nr:polysaccharide biosynthesis/export family protein [Oculatella sp. LEGE 06141]MBE9182376.1 polysaccharide biosynthesis/export family protein [Oculatella sp. LEGE 06141]
MLLRTSLSVSVAVLTTAVASLPGFALPLSPGDRIRVTIPGESTILGAQQLPQEYRFSGLYEVNLDGTLQVPLLQPMLVSGKEIAQVEQELNSALVQGGFFQPQFLQASVQVVDWGPVQVTISGATFEPGRVLISDRLPTSNRLNVEGGETANDQPQRQIPVTVSGEYPEGRYLTAAIRKAGGLAPTADIENIRLIRGEQEQVVDLSGVLTGEQVEDIALIAGDQVIVPDLETLQTRLVRPSQVTPSAIAVFVSNQTAPSPFSAGEFARFEYGSRFSQAVVSARCAGGGRSTNANRRVTLVRTERVSGKTEVIDRQAEDLLRDADDQTVNPFLMPGDSVVCYDSRVQNTSGILDFIGNVLNPFRAIRDIFFNND